MTLIYSRIKPAFIVLILTFSLFSCTTKPSLRALIITGVESRNMQGSYVAMRNILEKTDIFAVNTAKAPWGEDMSEFVIDFTPFDVVILNYTGYDWPEETKKNFINYVENGGGVVVTNVGNNAFPDWNEYNEIIGLQVQNNAPAKSNIEDESEGSSGPLLEFVVKSSQPEHPVLKGLPVKWLHEMNAIPSGSVKLAENTEILATLHSMDENSGNEKDHVALFTSSYGAGRIFHTLLGQAGNTDILSPALECAGFITTLQRGTEWAATGKVTQKVPEEFPDETGSVQWKYYEYMDIGIVSKRISEYGVGKSTNCFIALKDYIAEDINNESRMNEYHEVILEILRSGSASAEGKKILLKDFSWIATEDYRSVYEELSSDPDLKEEALFALGRMN